MRPFETLVDQIGLQERVPGHVAQALVDTENEARNPDLVLSEDWGGGSHGLTMITLTTARGLGFRGTSAQLNEPKTNLLYGLRYLRQMFDQVGNGDWARAYAGYNAGPDLSPWPANAVRRFQGKLDYWISVRRPPGFQKPPTPATNLAAIGGGLQRFLILGLIFTFLVNMVKGKR